MVCIILNDQSISFLLKYPWFVKTSLFPNICWMCLIDKIDQMIECPLMKSDQDRYLIGFPPIIFDSFDHHWYLTFLVLVHLDNLSHYTLVYCWVVTNTVWTRYLGIERFTERIYFNWYWIVSKLGWGIVTSSNPC